MILLRLLKGEKEEKKRKREKGGRNAT